MAWVQNGVIVELYKGDWRHGVQEGNGLFDVCTTTECTAYHASWRWSTGRPVPRSPSLRLLLSTLKQLPITFPQRFRSEHVHR